MCVPYHPDYKDIRAIALYLNERISAQKSQKIVKIMYCWSCFSTKTIQLNILVFLHLFDVSYKSSFALLKWNIVFVLFVDYTFGMV